MLWLFACTGTEPVLDDTGPVLDDTAPSWPEGLAEITEPSDGECPDLSVDGYHSFSSSGGTRSLSVRLPATVDSETQVIVFLHGLMDPAQTPEPTEYMADGLDFSGMANDMNAIVLAPESLLRTELGQSFYLFDVEGSSEGDMVLFDDLRSCVYEQHRPDMTRLSIAGFSGGALFATMIASQRGDTLSTVVEMSGGADIEVIIAEGLVAAYETPAWSLPMLLWSGGETDVWPDPGFQIVNFEQATDNLQANLVEDGHFAVRCEHDLGHTINNAEWRSALTWIDAHRFGEASPFVGTDVTSLDSSCEIAQ